MTKRQATDLVERLWGEKGVTSSRQFRRPRFRVGRFSDGVFCWLGAGSTWERAFSQALSANPLNEQETFEEILFQW